MKYIASLFLLGILCYSCKRPKIPLLTANNLPSSFATINAGKDNRLKTAKGAIIKITANSFKVPAGTAVKIELKEAYNIQDILAAGLTTKSNGKLLQSSGMIYFNATANGSKVEILKPVEITTPAAVYNKNMQLFKGEVGEDSVINWVKPAPLDTSALARNLLSGELLFKYNCANCHKPLTDATGPALAGARNREPAKTWAYKFVNNVNAMLEVDWYAKSLLAKYGSRMTQFNLPEQDIKNNLEYCDNEAALYKPELLIGKPFQGSIEAEGAFTDCGFDTIPVPVMDTTIQPFMEDTVLDETNDLTDTGAATLYRIPEKPGYSFSIEACGWYNIDCFLKDYARLTYNVDLSVSLSGNLTKTATVNLCIPSRNLLTDASIGEDGKYVFSDIKLIMGDEAFVFVVEGDETNVLFGSNSFKVQSKQQIDISLKSSSKATILDAFKRNNLDGVKIDQGKNRIEIILPPGSPGPIKKSNLPDSIANKVEWEVIKSYCDFLLYPDASIKILK